MTSVTVCFFCQATLYGTAAFARLERLKELAGRENDSYKSHDESCDSCHNEIHDSFKKRPSSFSLLRQSLWNATIHKTDDTGELNLISSRDNGYQKASLPPKLPTPPPTPVIPTALAHLPAVVLPSNSCQQDRKSEEWSSFHLPLSRVPSVDSLHSAQGSTFVGDGNATGISPERHLANVRYPPPSSNSLFNLDSQAHKPMCKSGELKMPVTIFSVFKRFFCVLTR